MEQDIKTLAMLELIKTLRIIKRQLKIIRAMPLNTGDLEQINQAIISVEQDFKIFKI